MKPEPIATIVADDVQVSGPQKTDRSYQVKFSVGEYQAENVKKLIGQHDTNLTLVIFDGNHE